MKAKKILLPFFVLLWMATIFTFSHQTAKTSQNLSDEVSIKVLEVKKTIVKQEISTYDKENFAQMTRIFIRKSAHFMFYLILGILLFLTFKNYKSEHPIIFALLICFLYACSDEIHQLFIEERTARVMGVCIDTCGAIVGIGISYLLLKKQK